MEGRRRNIRYQICKSFIEGVSIQLTVQGNELPFNFFNVGKLEIKIQSKNTKNKDILLMSMSLESAKCFKDTAKIIDKDWEVSKLVFSLRTTNSKWNTTTSKIEREFETFIGIQTLTFSTPTMETPSMKDQSDSSESQEKKNSDVIFSVTIEQMKQDVNYRDQDCLCQSESNFIYKRTKFVLKKLKKNLNGLPIDASIDDVPHIAIIGSGGGMRAVIGMSGAMAGLQNNGILDYAMYTAGLSGSAWYLLTLYAFGAKLDEIGDVNSNIRRNLHHFNGNPLMMALNVLKYYLKKIIGPDGSYFTMANAFGVMIGNLLLKRVPKWSFVLYDINGDTATVESTCLNSGPKKNVKVTVVTGSESKEVEVLKLAETKNELDKFAKEWRNSQRAKAIKREIERRKTLQKKEYGFLKVEPNCEYYWSGLQKSMKKAIVPLPLVAALHVRNAKTVNDHHEWIEFSPYEVFFPRYGASIDMQNFGKTFHAGYVTDVRGEKPIHFLLGMCGSAYTVVRDIRAQGFDWYLMWRNTSVYMCLLLNTFDNIFVGSVPNFLRGITKIEDNCKYEANISSDQSSDNSVSTVNISSDQRSDNSVATANISSDQRSDNSVSTANVSSDERSDNSVSTANISSDQRSDKSVSTVNISSNALSDQHGDSSESKDVTGIWSMFPGFCKMLLRLCCKSAPIIYAVTNGAEPFFKHSGDARIFYNYWSIFENWISTLFGKCVGTALNMLLVISGQEPFFEYHGESDSVDILTNKMMLVDAGIAFNSPYPAVLHPAREIDIIISFDFSDRGEDTNRPFEELIKAAKWAKSRNIPFPQIEELLIPIHKAWDAKEYKHMYVFEGKNDEPTVVHFVMKGTNPTENEPFDVLPDYSTLRFSYTEKEFNKLNLLISGQVDSNIEDIKKYILKAVVRKKNRQ